MKNVKTFYESQTAICVKLPTKQKLPYISEINIFGRIFTGMHKFAFQVLRECSFWASRNGAVCSANVFSDANQKTRFWLCCKSIFLSKTVK